MALRDRLRRLDHWAETDRLVSNRELIELRERVEQLEMRVAELEAKDAAP